jgi:hypothetical protein
LLSAEKSSLQETAGFTDRLSGNELAFPFGLRERGSQSLRVREMNCPSVATDQSHLGNLQEPPAWTALVVDALNDKGHLRGETCPRAGPDKTVGLPLIAFRTKPMLFGSIA